MIEKNAIPLTKLKAYAEQAIISLVNFLVTNRNSNSRIFTRDTIDAVYALIETSPIIEPPESEMNVRNIIWNSCIALDDDVRIEQTSRHGNLNYGFLFPMANDALSLTFLSHSLIHGSDTAQLWVSLNEYFDRLSERKKRRNRVVYLWDLCSYVRLLLAYKSVQGDRYDKNLLKGAKELSSEVIDRRQLPGNLVGYMLVLLKMIEAAGLVQPNLNYIDMYRGITWRDSYRDICYKIYDGLTLGVEPELLKADIDHLVCIHEKGRPRITELSALLLFASKLLMRNKIKVKVPFFTYGSTETTFFGEVVMTYLKVCEILETEKKSIEADENTLRNRFLEGLKLRFGSSATAETSRCNGLTDILAINLKNPNEEIVTEVKIWKGPKYYQKGITQAVKYLRAAENKVIMISINTSKLSRLQYENSLLESIKSHPLYVTDSLNKGIVKRVPFGTFYDAYLYSDLYREKGSNDKVRVHHIFLSY